MNNFAAKFNKRKYGGAKGRHKQGVMNSLEKWYSQILNNQILAGEVVQYWFEEVKFRLADKTFYTPDFLVMYSDLTLEIHETKGYMLDDANVKIKVAADKFPFKFKIIKKGKGGVVISQDVGNIES